MRTCENTSEGEREKGKHIESDKKLLDTTLQEEIYLAANMYRRWRSWTHW